MTETPSSAPYGTPSPGLASSLLFVVERLQGTDGYRQIEAVALNRAE